MREALADSAVAVSQVLVARSARGVEDIVASARSRGAEVRLVSADKVTRMSGNGRHDQGVVAVVEAPAASGALGPRVVLLDGVTNPSNVGMIVRAAAAFGFEVLVPEAGSPDVGPLMVKASAGVALSVPVRRCATAAEGVAALRAAGFRVVGLAAGAAASIESVRVDGPVALVLGNETAGLSVEVDELVSIPMAAGVESLNVAVAAGIACFALSRARLPD